MSETYSIVGIKKLKTNSEIAAMSAHWMRLNDTPNANSRRTHLNRCVLGFNNPYEGFKKLTTDRGIVKFRKNGVRLIEMVLAFSPEYLRESKTGPYKQDAKVRLRKWVNASVSWLTKEYGERCLSAYLHGDESNFHIHAAILPLEKKTRKSGVVEWTLNARGITGGKEKLMALHDSYAESVTHLGLRRGKRFSKAKHVTIRDFYTSIEESKQHFLNMGLAAPDSDPTKQNLWRKNMSNLINALRNNENQKIEQLEMLVRELNQAKKNLQNQLNAHQRSDVTSLRRSF